MPPLAGNSSGGGGGGLSMLQQHQPQSSSAHSNLTPSAGGSQQQQLLPPPLHHQSQPPPLSQTSAATSSQASQPSQPPPGPQAAVAGLHPTKIVPIQITLPPQPSVPNSEPRVLTIQVPASALQENQLHQVLTGPIITSIMSLPVSLASSVLQQHVNAVLQNNTMPLPLQRQLDGTQDTSDDDGSDVSDDNLDGDDDDDLDKEDDEEIDGEGGAEEEPLNSDDDVSEEEHADLFETDNVIVCQYDKVSVRVEFCYCFGWTNRIGVFRTIHRSRDRATNGSST